MTRMLWVVVVHFVNKGWLTADAAILDGVQYCSEAWFHRIHQHKLFSSNTLHRKVVRIPF